jgi:hypothetical protein
LFFDPSAQQFCLNGTIPCVINKWPICWLHLAEEGGPRAMTMLVAVVITGMVLLS